VRRRQARATSRSRSPSSLAALLSAFALAASSNAWALCPNCLAQQSTLTPTLKLVGMFLVVPFAVAAAVYLVVRRTVYGRPGPAGVASPAVAPPSLPASAPPSSAGGVQAG
jgi:hypothetical protein